MRRYWLVTVLGLLVMFGGVYQAPWVQGRTGTSDDVSLGFAPIWSSGFRSFPDAHVDWVALATHISLALGVVVLIGLGQSLRRGVSDTPE